LEIYERFIGLRRRKMGRDEEVGKFCLKDLTVFD
jgi:hypothetical protein